MASQRLDNNKDTLYAIFSESKRGISREQQERAYMAAKAFLLRYGGDGDAYVTEANQFVTEFDRKVSEYDLYAAYNAKNYSKAFELGRPLLKTDATNFFALSLLAEAGFDNAQAGNASLNDETIDYLRRANELLDSGKVTKPDPFKSLEIAKGFLNYALGSLVKDKSPVEAAAAFSKAVQPGSPYQNDPLTYYRLGVTTLKGPYAQLSAEYNEKYGARQGSAEQQAALERISHLVTRAIDAYARAVALSDPARSAKVAPLTQFTPEFRGKVLAQLTALYKSYHNNSEDGLNELISGVLAKPLP